jgi:pyridoxine 5-phosphate synthase
MKLKVNIDHIATLREARRGVEPDPVAAAVLCELAGADGIVCHLREDRRHIGDRDVRLLRDTVKTMLDLEMAATEEMVAIACEVLPDLVTLVPENRAELTTEGGLDVIHHRFYLIDVVKTLHSKEIEVSLFIDPDEEHLEAAALIGADVVELHTGAYANARTPAEALVQLERIAAAAESAVRRGLRAHAGHGLNYWNVKPIAEVAEIHELSIGHSIIARAALVGLERAVREMREKC